ncbi:MAG TPA: YhjD/YihY/BrkB family envelope integrity protein [Candidatus Saccharimonadales bacterium]|nr:YhjD/YihY/BrkB family envelope integrity protein [Candidatus Saccharimonadales bacterium]
MSKLQTFIRWIDRLQQKHRVVAFSVAVISKYNDDGVGWHAAMLTYYSFLSLFPLLLLLTTVVNSVLGNDSHTKMIIIKGLTDYFPLIGNQLSNDVHKLHTSGLALIAGFIFLIYGTRGVANAFSKSVQDIWGIPLHHRDVFPKTFFKSFLLVITGGIGLLTASVIASLASAAGKGLDFRLLSIGINFFILFWLFRLLLDLSLPTHVPLKETRIGAGASAIGLIIIQLLGGYIISHELKHLNSLYSYFAITLGLLFWLYLQSQVIYYSIEIALVSSRKLWPKRLTT